MSTPACFRQTIPLSTAMVSANTLGPGLAVEALVQMGNDRHEPITQSQVAVFLILAEKYGWDHLRPAFVHGLDFDGEATKTTWQETLLEWLTSHPQDSATGIGTRTWPSTLEGFRALDSEEHPPVRDQEWLMALTALICAPSENQREGIPLSLYNCFLNRHMSILDLVLRLPGAPSMASLFHTFKTDARDFFNNPPTWGKWVLEYREGQLPHLTQTYPDLRLTPEQVAACRPEILPLVIAWLPTDKEFRDNMLRRLEKHLNADDVSPLSPNEWIRIRRLFLEYPPAAEEEKVLLRQAVVNEAMRFSYGKPGRDWTADSSFGSADELLLGQETTHPRIKGPLSVLSALLLKDLFGRSFGRRAWERYVGTVLDSSSKREGMAGILAPALNQSFGPGLPLRGLIAISLMGSAMLDDESKGTLGGCDTTAAFLLGFMNTSDFIRNSMEDVIFVTKGLVEHLDSGSRDAHQSIVKKMAFQWATFMRKERERSNQFLLDGQMDFQLYWWHLLFEWCGFWYLPDIQDNRDEIDFFLNEIMHAERGRLPWASLSLRGDEEEQGLRLLKTLCCRSPDGLRVVISALKQQLLSERNIDLISYWINMEKDWYEKHIAPGKNAGWKYPLDSEILYRLGEAVLSARLPDTDLLVHAARL